MSIFGLMTKREVQAQLDALKADLMPNLHQWLLETADAERFNLGDPSKFEQPSALYRQLSWILMAIDNTASAGALARFDVKRVVNDKEPKDIPNHPFEQLLRHPNALDSRYEFLYATIAMYKLTGNGYWWLNRANESAPPDEMWLIPSHMIIPVPDEQMYLRGYLYYPGNGREILLPPHEIIHFRRFNPFSRFLGLSAVESIARLAVGDLAMQQWNTTLFGEKNGMLPGILAFEQMVADPTWSKIKQDTKEAQKNRSLLMLRGVGQGASAKGGVSWLQNNVSQKDMEFLEGRKATGKEIMDTLAPGLYTWLSGESTYSNAGANRAAFNELTLYPMHVMMAEKITNEILPAYGGRPLLGEFEDVRVNDRELELKEQERYALTHTIAEIRENDYGDEPLGDERDDLLIAQINAQSGGIQEPPPAPGMTPPKDGVPAEEKPKQPEAEKPAPAKAAVSRDYIEALSKYERYALRMIGKPLNFQNDYLSAKTVAAIAKDLTDCKDSMAVKMVFAQARARMTGGMLPEEIRPPVVPEPQPAQPNNDAIITLANAMNGMTAAMKAQSNSTSTLDALKAIVGERAQSIYFHPATINLPQGEQNIHVTVPDQPAPVVHNSYSHTIAAAQAPDVHIDSPVHISQTIEPAALPATNVSITNQIPEQAAPVTHVSIENKMPEAQPGNTTIKNEFTMPELPAAQIVVNVPEQAAPNVSVVNEVNPTPIKNEVNVKVPKLKKSKDRVERDPDNLITGKTTDYDYEDDK
jgi:phage portal protein BeeE